MNRSNDPITSKIAAGMIKKDIPRQHYQVLTALKNHPKKSNRQLHELTGIDYEVIHKRMPELERRGLVERVGIVTQSNGRPATVWSPV